MENNGLRSRRGRRVSRNRQGKLWRFLRFKGPQTLPYKNNPVGQ